MRSADEPSQQTPARAFIAIGANLGDRAATIRSALETLDRSDGVDVVRVSTLIENPAVGGPAESPPFLNGAAELSTTLNPHALLARLLDIERSLGRERRQRWAPRTIDLDLLLYGDEVIQTNNLTVPHPLMHERDFVLAPLAEIAPDVVHPLLHVPIRHLAMRPRS
ncbi:MAG TPA: 2-amino-4-hydroxy-6-hydroxymethyldihydropteridine diphosphokinase [Tepidisphaeraceae bacterium]|nr:2-amino-4-hydroxy-6-hydroxymethyldihydropteridine diphosphokinase [Tepidisphaeraceae bacterium]